MRLTIIAFLMLLTAACISPVPDDAHFWLNGKTREQLIRDSQECEREAVEYADSKFCVNGRLCYRRCMYMQGYQQIGEESKYPTTPGQARLLKDSPASPARDKRIGEEAKYPTTLEQTRLPKDTPAAPARDKG